MARTGSRKRNYWRTLTPGVDVVEGQSHRRADDHVFRQREVERLCRGEKPGGVQIVSDRC